MSHLNMGDKLKKIFHTYIGFAMVTQYRLFYLSCSCAHQWAINQQDFKLFRILYKHIK